MKPTEKVDAATAQEVAELIYAEQAVNELLKLVEALFTSSNGISPTVLSRSESYKSLAKVWDKVHLTESLAIDLQQSRNALPNRLDDCLDQLMNLHDEIKEQIKQLHKAQPDPKKKRS